MARRADLDLALLASEIAFMNLDTGVSSKKSSFVISPWFQKGDFVKSKAQPQSGARWHLLTIIQIKCLAILFVRSWYSMVRICHRS